MKQVQGNVLQRQNCPRTRRQPQQSSAVWVRNHASLLANHSYPCSAGSDTPSTSIPGPNEPKKCCLPPKNFKMLKQAEDDNDKPSSKSEGEEERSDEDDDSDKLEEDDDLEGLGGNKEEILKQFELTVHCNIKPPSLV
jgi:hypothetical protein